MLAYACARTCTRTHTYTYMYTSACRSPKCSGGSQPEAPRPRLWGWLWGWHGWHGCRVGFGIVGWRAPGLWLRGRI
eukprot:1156859-Pelagomonas_calceolata.AAC.8